jgi:hypothetical protein
MQTWIFQGNPDDYDIDGYLNSRPAQLDWLVTRYASEIAVGDRVYLWRKQGNPASGFELCSYPQTPPYGVAGTAGDTFDCSACRSLVRLITRSEAIVRAARLESAAVIFMPSGVKVTTK